MYSIGIDQSSNHTGVAVLNLAGELQLLELIEPKVKDTERLVFIRDTLRKLLRPFENAAIGVWESYSMGSVNRPFLLGEVGGIVQLQLFDLVGAQGVKACPPKVLKKFVANNASADKAKMMHAVHMRWGVELSDDNLADAYGLAQFGLSLLNPVGITARKQLEARSTVLAPKKKRNKPFRMDRGQL